MINIKPGDNRQGCRFIERDVAKYAREKGLFIQAKDKEWRETIKKALRAKDPSFKYCTDTVCYCDER